MAIALPEIRAWIHKRKNIKKRNRLLIRILSKPVKSIRSIITAKVKKPPSSLHSQSLPKPKNNFSNRNLSLLSNQAKKHQKSNARLSNPRKRLWISRFHPKILKFQRANKVHIQILFSAIRSKWHSILIESIFKPQKSTLHQIWLPNKSLWTQFLTTHSLKPNTKS